MVNKEFVKIIADTGQLIYVPVATLENLGISKPDGLTISIENGVLSIADTVIGDIEALKDGKVKRIDTGSGLRVYSHRGSAQGDTLATDAPDANSIIARDQFGSAKIVTLPDTDGNAQPDDITNRDYVNNKLKGLLSNVTYDDQTHEIKFDRVNEDQILIDLPIESLIKNIELDGNDLVITFEDGSEPKRIPLGTLLVGVVRSVNGEIPNQTTGNVVLNRVDSVEVEVSW